MKGFIKSINNLSLRDRLLILGSTTVSIAVGIYLAQMPQDTEYYLSLGLGGLALACLLNGASVFSPVPLFLLVFLASFKLDHLPLILVATTASTTGEFSSYLLGRGLQSLTLDYKVINTLKRWFYRAPFLFLTIWIAIPNPTQSIGQIFAGTAGYPWWKYFAANYLGNLIWYTALIKIGGEFLSLSNVI